MSNLLEAGVHFGHQTKRWNPKMKEYIFSTRDDIYIMDLQKTTEKLEEAYNALKTIVENGGKVLFVGTKKQAAEVCKEEAARTGMYFMTERWLGGTLTILEIEYIILKKSKRWKKMVLLISYLRKK